MQKTGWPFLIIVTLLLSSCSTTRNLPEDEVLYTGMKKTILLNEDKSPAGENAMQEVDAALFCQPNNAFPGSTWRIPFPFGLWVYNDFVKYKKGLGKWIFDKLAAKPVYISSVNPEIRSKIASNLLHDYGFFNGTVNYEIIPNPKNEKKAKVQYTVDMKNLYTIDSVAYLKFPPQADSLIRKTMPERLLRRDEAFSVTQLEAERERLSTLFRNNGFFYFRPNFITYLADTVQTPGKVNLRIRPEAGLQYAAQHPWYIGRTTVYLTGYNGEPPTDSVSYRRMKVFFSGKKPGIRRSVLYKHFNFRKGDLYSQQAQQEAIMRLNRTGIFRYTEFQYTPRDTTQACDTLDLRVNAAFDLPLDGQLELNFTSKSNDQMGPGAEFSVTKRNIFRGGENLSVKLTGSYEWQTHSPVDGKKSVINSYELGISASLDYPRIMFPWLGRKVYRYPATTTFRLYADQLNRANYFKLLAFGGNATYVLQKTPIRRNSITPFRLTFNVLQSTTHTFDSITAANPALYMSLKNQFIPAMSYTYTYDNASVTSLRNHTWWETSVTSAGNLTSVIYAAFGESFKKQNKELLGNPFAQFLKLTSEIRYNYKIGTDQYLAMRLMGGAIYSYGNARVAPYNEQFYIGGANSIRAFTVRSLGPGSFRPQKSTYSYIDQTGDLKLEANIEYRFKLIGKLHGATFLDAGNIWLLREDPSRPGGKFSFKTFGKEIALGTGAGLRYDLTFLVIRLDLGIALHAPYKTDKKGYYNIPKFKDGLGLHLAIGYPF